MIYFAEAYQRKQLDVSVQVSLFEYKSYQNLTELCFKKPETPG